MTAVQSYLATKLALDGYSGLYANDCGCTLEDLWPCDGPGFDCRPGYQHGCEVCPRHAADDCPMEDGGVGGCVSSSKDWPAPRVDE